MVVSRVSAAAKLGKLTTIQEDSVIASSKSWWRTSKYHTKFDVHLCGKLASSVLDLRDC